MTGVEFLTYVKKIFMRTDKDAEIYEAIKDTVMDMRVRMYSEDYSVESSALTGISSVGDFKLNLPDDFGHLIGDVLIYNSVTNQDYLPLKKISKESYDQKYSDHLLSANRWTGVPREYCVFGNKIYLGPAVDSTNYAFKINHTQEDSPTITSGTANVPFTEKHRETVRYGVIQRVYELLENYQESEVYERKYENGIAKIVANDNENTKSYEPIRYSGV